MPASTSSSRQRSNAPDTLIECPGTIVTDFEALMDFIGSGVRSTGKHHLLPMAQLNELDELMTTPLRPKLQRPQQRSFPHLHGLYVLLRATRIGVPDGHGKTNGKLVLDPFMCEQWAQLNPTEKYCNLLEAWLRKSSWSSVGGHNPRWQSGMLMNALDASRSVPQEGRHFSSKRQKEKSFFHSEERSTTMALLELFGLLTVKRGEPVEGINWPVAELHRTELGEELLTKNFNKFELFLYSDDESDVDFGVWQSMLQPIFPQWNNNLKFPEPEFRYGIYYFKVSLGKPWRQIAIDADNSLDELAECILDAFDFDGDHLYEFRITEPDATILTIAHPHIQDADLQTDEFAIGYLPLKEGDSIPFLYDFGADWRFTVTLEKIKPPDSKITQPIVVKSRGKAPKEYDDEW